MTLLSPPSPRDLSPSSDGDELGAVAGAFGAAPRELVMGRQLLRRVDTKFVCSQQTAAAILASLTGDYAALTVPSGNVAGYRSLYFDTPDLRCFHDHRRGRRLRHKIRIRHYPDRALTFLEVKSKQNEALTAKQRLALGYGAEALAGAERAFLAGVVDLPVGELAPMMRVDFRRLSLVGVHTAERVTIDLGVVAESLDGLRWSAGDRVVIEVKQEPFCVRTPAMRAIRDAGLREQSMSKYTIATALVRPELRRNRLLPVLRGLARMSE